MGLFSGLFGNSTQKRDATLIDWTDMKMWQFRHANDVTPEMIFVGFMHGLVSFARKDKQSTVTPPQLQHLHEYKNDAALFELGCYGYWRVLEFLAGSDLDHRDEVRDALFCEFVILFRETLHDPNIDQICRHRLKTYGTFCVEDARPDRCLDLLTKLIARTRHSQQPTSCTDGDACGELDPLDVMVLKTKITNWSEEVLPAILTVIKESVGRIR